MEPKPPAEPVSLEKEPILTFEEFSNVDTSKGYDQVRYNA
jgi:hypothetical protein